MTTIDWLPLWLKSLWEVPGITDIVVNGPDEVFLDRGLGLEKADFVPGVMVPPLTVGDVRALAVRLASVGCRRLDDASPTVDARLPDGTRLHAVLPPVAPGCAAISLRMVRSTSLTIDDLVVGGMVHPAVAALLTGLVEVRASLIISGATGAGKSTLLSTLLSSLDPRERVVIIEEAGELVPSHPHVVRLVSRAPNVDGAGAIGLPQLVREALRMRPDRIVVGECRGEEIREVMLALNTGHGGSLTTIHANTAADVPARLVALGALAGWDERSVTLHAHAGFAAVVHLSRGALGRRVASVAALGRVGDALVVSPAISVTDSGDVEYGSAWSQLSELAGLRPGAAVLAVAEAA